MQTSLHCCLKAGRRFCWQRKMTRSAQLPVCVLTADVTINTSVNPHTWTSYSSWSSFYFHVAVTALVEDEFWEFSVYWFMKKKHFAMWWKLIVDMWIECGMWLCGVWLFKCTAVTKVNSVLTMTVCHVHVLKLKLHLPASCMQGTSRWMKTPAVPNVHRWGRCPRSVDTCLPW